MTRNDSAADLPEQARPDASADAEPEIAPPALAMTADVVGPDPAAPPTPPRRARIRWGGIVWGLVFAAVAAAGISLASTPGRTEALVAWVQEIGPASAIGLAVATIGGLLLVTGVVGLVRRAQRSLAARNAG